ncbi:MAG TPA: metal-dependent transcriptional regulator [Anaerolineales bacterium]|nr:metal-dependent transcriptional regulator [Anaerolineales bacterium]
MSGLQVLILSLAFAFLLAAIFHPQRGLLVQWRARSVSGRRNQVEDALKYLLKQEQSGRHASPEALAGAMHLSGTEILGLITRMEAQGLLKTLGGGLHLTPDGERWALHVVRAHRLWERYLADEARLPLQQVHREAERREHGMTPEQLDDLEASLGHPDHDPHGDPIPSRLGAVQAAGGTPLTAWSVDIPGQIVHLEDEPPLAYAQILAEGLRLGQKVRVLQATPERVVLSDGENEYRLAPAVAANVHLAPIPEALEAQSGVMLLSQLPDGVAGEVVALDDACQGFTRRRLLDLGMTPGARLRAEMRNFFGDPRAYRVRGTLIALRREQAAQVWVKSIGMEG